MVRLQGSKDLGGFWKILGDSRISESMLRPKCENGMIMVKKCEALTCGYAPISHFYTFNILSA
jgi:hypothetical protein